MAVICDTQPSLWRHVLRAYERGQAAGASGVLRAASLEDLSMLLQSGSGAVRVTQGDEVGTQCLFAVAREAIRLERLQALDDGPLVSLLKCMRRLWIRGMELGERKALLDAWTHEVQRRGVSHVVQDYGQLAAIMHCLADSCVKVNDGLVRSLLEMVGRMEVQSTDYLTLQNLVFHLGRLPGAVTLYGEQVQGILLKDLPQQVDPHRSIFRTFRHFGWRTSGGTISKSDMV